LAAELFCYKNGFKAFSGGVNPGGYASRPATDNS
jgi:hypothetical protein